MVSDILICQLTIGRTIYCVISVAGFFLYTYNSDPNRWKCLVLDSILVTENLDIGEMF